MCRVGLSARFLPGRRKRKWQLVTSLVLFTLRPAWCLALFCLLLSALPAASTPRLQKKRTLLCWHLLTAFYFCTPVSWIKSNSYSPLNCLSCTSPDARLRHVWLRESFADREKQSRNKQQTCWEVGGSCTTFSLPAAGWVCAIYSHYLQYRALQSHPSWEPGPWLCAQFTLKGSVTCCLLRFVT